MKPPRTDALQGAKGQLKYFLEQLAKVLARNVTFGSAGNNNTDQDQNIDVFKASGQTGAPNAEFSISAGAGNTFFRDKHIPWGFVVANKTAAADFYQGVTPWTASTIYLKSTVQISYTLFIL